MTDDLKRAARNLRTARGRLDKAMSDAEQAAISATSAGVSEVEVAKALGVNRMTVRRWLGKL